METTAWFTGRPDSPHAQVCGSRVPHTHDVLPNGALSAEYREERPMYGTGRVREARWRTAGHLGKDFTTRTTGGYAR